VVSPPTWTASLQPEKLLPVISLRAVPPFSMRQEFPPVRTMVFPATTLSVTATKSMPPSWLPPLPMPAFWMTLPWR
jgi:hypothetical protein